MQQDCHEIGMQHKIKTAMVCKHLATAKALFGVACRFVIFCGVAIQKVFLFFWSLWLFYSRSECAVPSTVEGPKMTLAEVRLLHSFTLVEMLNWEALAWIARVAIHKSAIQTRSEKILQPFGFIWATCFEITFGSDLHWSCRWKEHNKKLDEEKADLSWESCARFFRHMEDGVSGYFSTETLEAVTSFGQVPQNGARRLRSFRIWLQKTWILVSVLPGKPLLRWSCALLQFNFEVCCLIVSSAIATLASIHCGRLGFVEAVPQWVEASWNSGVDPCEP